MRTSDPIYDMAKRVRSLNKMLEKAAGEAVRDEEAYILELNIDQLSRGDDSKGKAIAPPYSQQYKAYKSSKGRQTRVVDLRLEGDFYQGLYVEFRDDEFEIKGQDFKTPFLKKRYGDLILGLDKVSVGKLQERLSDRIKTALESIFEQQRITV